MTAQQEQHYEIGMVGLGVMGRNMVLNMADHGFSVAGYDKDVAKIEELSKESVHEKVRGVTDIKAFIGALQRPRAVMMLVPAAPGGLGDRGRGPSPGEGGPHHRCRQFSLQGHGHTCPRPGRQRHRIPGVGVSGGEDGARHGPSIIPAGRRVHTNGSVRYSRPSRPT